MLTRVERSVSSENTIIPSFSSAVIAAVVSAVLSEIALISTVTFRAASISNPRSPYLSIIVAFSDSTRDLIAVICSASSFKSCNSFLRAANRPAASFPRSTRPSDTKVRAVIFSAVALCSGLSVVGWTSCRGLDASSTEIL